VYVGKTLFAQVMEFVPWTSFARIVQRHGGNSGVRTLSCAEQFRAMAFAQLTWRESLRDIEASLSANAGKLYAMGFGSAVKRSTLADANESRDWRIWSDLAALLIRRARKLYAGDAVLGVDLDNTVYALDSSTIDLCLSLFDWAPFRSTKAAIKLHTLLDLRGAIPAFIHISDGKLIDGGKALHKAIVQTFGVCALIQRCQEHKRRNVLEHLPEDAHASVKRALKDAWSASDADLARKQLSRLASMLQAKHPGAAASLREGLEETLTVQALGITAALYRTLRTTNPIENLNGSVAHYCRNVKRWGDGQMVLRWCVFRTNVTARFGSVTAEFGSVTGRSGDVTAGGFAPA
jgi:hypothetical protein